MPKGFLPTADAQLLSWAQNFYARISGAEEGTYPLTTAQIAVFNTRLTTFSDAYQTAYEPTTRTRPAINAKDEAKQALATYARVCVGIIQKSPTVTDAQRLDLKITVAKKRTPVPMPTARPMVEVRSVVGRRVTVNVYDSTSLTKRGKPKNCIGAKLYTFVGDTYPSDPTLWAYQGDYTKTKCDILFPDTVAAGSNVFVCAAWYTRTSVGPVCMPIATVIQYGGVQAQSPAMKMAA